MKFFLKHRTFLYIFPFLCVAIFLWAQSLSAQTLTGAETDVLDTLDQIGGVDTYTFVAQIEQTLIPRAVPLNVGMTEERVDSQLTAEVRPDHTRFNWQFEADAGLAPIVLEQDGDQFFVLDGEERTEIQNPLAGITPSSDFGSYLRAAQNIRPSETSHPDYAVYDFDIDGDALTDLILNETGRHLSREQRAAVGVSMTSLRLLSGQGQLFIDGDGLPRRQIMSIDMPEVTDRYDASTDFIIDYQYPNETPATSPQADAPSGHILNPLISSSSTASTPARIQTDLNESLMMFGLIALSSMILVGTLILFRRRLRIIVPLTLVVVMFTLPILQPVAHLHMHEVAVASAPPTLGDVLGVNGEDEVEDESAMAPEFEPEGVALASTAQLNQVSVEACGSGDETLDTDLDGLNDFVERCLGTNPFSIDTDNDGLTDTLEVEGFVFTDTLNVPHTIYTNPHDADSNGDGIEDVFEWELPIGFAPSIDGDGDNLPNPWDPDNDNDLIPDEEDLDPFAASDFRSSFSIVTDRTGDSFQGYQYVDLQVQPENQERLRLSTTALDWPYDEVGSIQARDRENLGELTFLPQLKIRTNAVPPTFVQDEYNISSERRGGGFDMYVPLLPINDGGQITGFSTRVAYPNSSFTTLNWSSVEFVWVAMMAASVGDGARTRTVPVAVYTESSFRITGLQVMKTSEQETAVIGTPNQQTNHRQLANTVFGVGAAFLGNEALDFDGLVSRLSTPTTPIDETWGVPVADLAVSSETARHPDLTLAGFFSVARQANDFLNDNNYDANELASIIVATENRSGLTTLDELEDLSSATYTFNTANISTQTVRGIVMSHYRFDNGNWSTVDVFEELPQLLDYYDDATFDAITVNLAETYPLIDTSDLLAVLVSFYVAWSIPSVSAISLDGVSLLDQQVTDEALNQDIFIPNETDFLTYVFEALNLGVAGGDVVFNSPQAYYEYEEASLVKPGWRLFGVSAELTLEFSDLIVRFTQRFSSRSTSGLAASQLSKFVGNKVQQRVLRRKAIKRVGNNKVKIQNWIKNYKKSTLANKGTVAGTKALSKTAKFWKVLVRNAALIGKTVAIVFSIALLGWSLHSIWKTYKDFESPYEFERDFALGVAVTNTIIEVSLASLSVVALVAAGFVASAAAVLAFGIAVIILVVELIGLLAKAFAKDGDEAEFGESLFATIIVKFFVGDVQLKTELRGINFEGAEVSVNREGFLVDGTTLTVKDKYTGRIEGFQYRDRLEKANTFAYFTASAGPNIAVSTADTRNAWRRCFFEASRKACVNDLEARYTFQNAGLNQEIRFLYNIEADLEYTKYILGGIRKVEKSENIVMPAELNKEDRWDEAVIYIDVLPATLDELLSWAPLDNVDEDADGVDDTTEIAAKATYNLSDLDNDGLAEELDWDSDGDGLSDGFEQATANTLHALWYLADSDGDGLNDSVEYDLNLSAQLQDSDSDGLTDGDEVYRFDGTTWTGGGWFIDILGTQYWTFSDPLEKDSDMDTVPDSSEKANGTSPYAFNTAPELTLVAGPTIDNASEGVYVRSGDPISATLNLDNIGTGPITTTLGLCFPSAVSNINVVTSGDRQPATQISGSCREWDFSGNPLQLFQSFQVTMTAEATGSTISDTIEAALPYTLNGELKPITQTVPYIQDNTAPILFISDPISNTILTSDFYVIGGNAVDTDSFVDRVEVTISQDGTHIATLTDAQWGYTWELPDDGDITISAVAYDVVGNVSAADTVDVIVDTLAPAITVNLAEGTTIAATEALSTTFPLSGTVTDNKAGIERVQLRYNDGPWRTIWDDPTAPLSASWSGIWEIPTVSTAQGKHNLELRAYDVYGNVDSITRTVFIDVLPPTNDLTNRAFIQETPRHVPAGPLDILGVASDAGNNPLPADPAELQGTLNSIEDATIWLQIDSLAENDAGATLNWLGDINGDRLGDLAVGLPAANSGSGRVVIVEGSPGDWPVPNAGGLEFLEDNNPSYVGTSSAAIGDIIEPAGDVNGNGIDDFLIGDPANDRIILILGSINNNASNNELNGEATAEIVIESTSAAEGLNGLTPNRVALAGDVTNDGLSDMLISFTGVTNTVYLMAGEAPFPTYQPIDLRAAFKLDTGAGAASVAGVGDVNNDFIDDFAVAFGNTVYLFAGGGGWIADGQTTLTTADAIATFATADALPTIAAGGDINGDNIDDFVFTNGSTPTVVFGNGSNSFSTQSLSNGVPLSGFLSAVGDVDKDGRGDLLIGNANDEGVLILGSDLNSVAATIEGVESSASAPTVAGSDLAGDGSSDLALVPTAAVAAALGYDGFGSTINAPFIPRSALPIANPIVAPVANSPANTLLPGDVIVAAVGGNFSSIQAAIDSGATRVLVEPGIYAEAFALNSDVTIIGSGADRTILTIPSGITNTVLITADGVSNASILNLTILGEGDGTALSVSGGASNIDLERTVVQGFETAVSVDGNTSTLALKNNTLIDNVNGFLATGNAGVDVRNTIFAYNSGVALQRDPGAVLELNQYNLYFANGSDLLPNSPGGGEIFSDPLFNDFASGDFRVASFSPVIDAGTPGDAVPPGAGDAVDIGHLEQSAVGFFIDGNYCSTCPNDGLIWGVNAFNFIQDGVDAALADLSSVELSEPISFTVGVNAGVYTETVVISGSINLVGRSPDTTAILGNGGPAVTFDAAVDAGVSGFTLMGGGTNRIGILMAGGSNTVDIDYNLIKNNSVGISVTQRATGKATFNTIISNTTGIEVSKGAIFNSEIITLTDNTGFVIDTKDIRVLADSCTSTILCEERGFVWLDTARNIISGNTNGLVANGKSVIFSDNNLLFNTLNYTNVFSGLNDIIDQDPLLSTPNGYLTVNSPALDAVVANTLVPAGGGVAADIGWHELLAAPLSVFMGQADRSIATESVGVGAVEYAIVEVADPTSEVTSTLPATWQTATLDNPGETLTYWRATATGTTDGAFYRVYSRATDSLGNTETDVNAWFDGAFYVDGSPPSITLTVGTEPLTAGFNFQPTWRILTVEVADYVGTSFDIDDIYFVIDGERIDGQWLIEDWEPDGVSPRTFYYLLRNESTSFRTFSIEAVAIDGAGNRATASASESIQGAANVELSIDIYPPTFVTITNPIPGQFVTDTVTFDIAALDADGFFCGLAPDCLSADSGIQGMEVSFDGGRTWSAATFVGLDDANVGSLYTFSGWSPPPLKDATTIPVRVRATDYFGFSTTEIVTISIDTEGPRLFGGYAFSLVPGSHLENLDPVTATLPAYADGSGFASRARFSPDFNNDNDPRPDSIELEPGNVATRIPGERSFLDFSIGVADEFLNFNGEYLGTWYGGGDFVQSIIMDGSMEVGFNEWITETERLDDDFRSGSQQTLWATWDFQGPYIGYQGASWGPNADGQLWIYYDFFDGVGSNQPISGTAQLPFDADYALQAVDSEIGYFWIYNDAQGVWERETEPLFTEPDPNGFFDFRDYGHDPESGTTEIHIFDALRTDTFDSYRIMVYGLDNNLEVFSAFPTANTLDGNFQHFYEWANVLQESDLLKLPVAARQPAVLLSIDSDPENGGQVTTADSVTLVANLTNIDTDVVDNLDLLLTATDGLTYQTVSGAASFDCSAGDSCTIRVPTIQVDGSTQVTITATTANDLINIEQITTTASLAADLPLPASNVFVRHGVDTTAPEVEISTNPGSAIGIGNQTVFGSADDEEAGIALVEISLDGVNWTPASGTNFWSAQVIAPDQATWELYARATDNVGLVSDPVSVTLTRDTTPPLITPNVIPETLSGYIYRFQGTSEDPTPTGGRTQRVEVQFDDPTGDWLVVPLFQTGTFWSYSWPLPEEDGVTHTVRFRATDFGDNTTVTNFESFVVDTVAPLVEVTSDTTQGLDTGQTLAGTISDGSGISRLTITLYPAVGDAIVQDIIPVNGVWSYSAGQPIGEYSYIIEAADLAGNRRVIGPLPLTIVDQLTTATLTGSLTFVGRGTPPNAFWVEAVDVTVHPVGVVTPTFSFNTTTDQNGQFTVNGITPGTYDVAVKPATGLRVVQELTLAAGGNSADFGTVPGGDVNGDNEVTLIDFSILSASFNLSEGDPGYDLRADLNGDNQVTALDFSILASNFNQSGETVGD